MKITQLDFSAIRSANAAQAQANQMRINVEAGTRNTQLTAYNVDTTDRYIKTVRTERRNKQILNTVMGFVDIGLDIASSAIDAKNKADAEASTYAMTQFANDLDQKYTELIRTDASAFYDEDNNLKTPDAVGSWKQEMLSQIDGMNVSNAYKDQMRSNLDRIFEIGQDSAIEQLSNREFENTLAVYEMSREDALKVDTSQPEPNPSQGYALIDGAGWMTPSEKETARAEYDKAFTARVQTNTASEIARTEGEDKAREYIDGLGLGYEESAPLYALAGDVATQTEASADAKVRRDIAAQLDNGIHPVVARTRVEAEISKMPEFVQESATHELDLAIYANGLKAMGITSEKDISSFMGDDLVDLEKRLDRGAEAYFPGLESEAGALKALVSGQFDKIATSNAKANIRTQDLAFSMWQQGKLSWKDAYDMIMGAQAFDGSTDGSDVEHAGSLIDRMENAYVPAAWESYDKSRKDGLKDIIAEARGLDVKDAADSETLDRAVRDAYSGIISYYANTPAEKVTQEGIDAAYQRATDTVIGEAITRLEEIEATGRTLVQQGAQELNLGNLSEVTSLMLNAPEGAIRVETVTGPGGEDRMRVAFGEDTYQRFWDEEIVLTVDTVRDGGLGDIEGHRIEPLWQGNEETGHYVPIPVMVLENGDSYMVYGDAVWKKPAGSNGFTIEKGLREIPEINAKYFNPGPAYDAPISTEAPLAAPIASDGFDDSIDEREMSPEEWRLTNYVESLEEEPQRSSRLAPASSIPDSAVVEEDPDKPEIPVRVVDDYTTEFWYEGRWYDVALLPEGNEVTAAYDRFNASYEGDFPEVRR